MAYRTIDINPNNESVPSLKSLCNRWDEMNGRNCSQILCQYRTPYFFPETVPPQRKTIRFVSIASNCLRCRKYWAIWIFLFWLSRKYRYCKVNLWSYSNNEGHGSLMTATCRWDKSLETTLLNNIYVQKCEIGTLQYVIYDINTLI